MKHFRIISLLLALCLLLGLTPAAGAEEPVTAPAPAETEWLVDRVKEAPVFPDVTGSWCEDAVKTVYQAGLMEGKTADRFDIASPLTNAQITVVCARLRSLLTGGDGVIPKQEGQPWYQGAYEVLWDAMEGHELFLPYHLSQDSYRNVANEPCTREDFVRTLSYAMLDTGVALPAINHVTVLPDLWQETNFGSISEAAFAFYNAGIITGTDQYGTFDAYGRLSRGQATAMLARLVDPAQRKTLSLKSLDYCREVIGLEPDTVLVTIDGLDITADQASFQLRISLTKEHVLDRLRYRVALMRLAEQRGILWSMEDIAESSPWFGISDEAWRWHMMETHLFTLLNGAPPDHHAQADGFYAELEAEIAAMEARLTVTPAPALETFDYPAFRSRAAAAPI